MNSISENSPNLFVLDDDVIQQISYVDGLGWPMQQIGLGQAPNRNDMVIQSYYDAFGRVSHEWLPTAMEIQQFGHLQEDVQNAISGYYNTPKFEDTQNPYSQKEFEPSPINRIARQAAPGNDWALDSGHEITFDYQVNSPEDQARLFEVTTVRQGDTFIPTLIESNFYEAGELQKTITYDENNTGGKNHSTEEFSNKSGQIVLKRTYADVEGQIEVAHDTYYVYDEFGNLSYVLPPKINLADGVSTTELNELSYQYTYDYRNRLVIKQIPGKGEEHIVYNKLNQPIMTQDPNQRIKQEWLFTKYDAFGRVAYTGQVNDGSNRTTVQNNADAYNDAVWVSKGSYTKNNIEVGYQNIAYPIDNITEIYTINYYDDYNFDRGNEPSVPTSIFGEAIDDRVKGVPTGSRVRVLETNDWITSISRYNYQGNTIYSYSENEYLNTTDLVTTKIDFVGRPLTVRAAHSRNGNTITTLDNFTYDHVGRLLTQTQCIGDENLGDTCPNGGSTVNAVAHLELANQTVTTNQVARERITIKPETSISGIVTLSIDPNATSSGGEQELIVNNTYDEIGQLVNKKVGGATTANGLQSVDYEYNVRGWLQGINDSSSYDNALTLSAQDLWGFRIKYNDIADGSKKLFNGNISETLWDSKSDNPSNSNPISKRYTYDYDPLNRITSAVDNTGNYNVSNISYDKNGNIMTLARQGQLASNNFGVMDDLVYSYDDGNKLLSVNDLPSGNDSHGFIDGANTNNEYVYDDNGNMTLDANKGITNIEYNYLNLPTQVTINANGNNGTISYIYDATGVKLEKQVSTGTNTEYCGNYIYENGNLQFFSQPEGYIDASGSGYQYVYQCKDHLGNIRLSYADSNNDGQIDASTEIIEESNYYPFGLKMRGYNSNVSSLGNSVAQRFKFGGREYDESLGLESYDFGSRHYMPDIGRWGNMDPLAEFMRNQSPFNFGFNNPIYFSDFAGTIPWPIPEFFKNWRRKNTPDEFFGFIRRRGRNHNGLDLNYNGGGNTDLGAPIVATHSGRVARVIPLSANDGGGRVVVLESPDGSFQTKYMHLSSVSVQPGDEVDEGATIGLMGGSAFGKELGRTVHLHYEIHRRNLNGTYSAINPWRNGTPIDPQQWIPQMGPFINAEAYNFGSSWSIFDIPFTAPDQGGQTSSSGSSNGSGSSNSSTTREPVSPVPVNPQPITPIPVTPPSGGGGTIPTPSPAPAPAPIPRPNCVDCGF